MSMKRIDNRPIDQVSLPPGPPNPPGMGRKLVPRKQASAFLAGLCRCRLCGHVHASVLEVCDDVPSAEDNQECSNCHNMTAEFVSEKELDYCPECGAKQSRYTEPNKVWYDCGSMCIFGVWTQTDACRIRQLEAIAAKLAEACKAARPLIAEESSVSFRHDGTKKGCPFCDAVVGLDQALAAYEEAAK